MGNGNGLIAGSTVNTIAEEVYGDMSADDIADEVDGTCEIGSASYADGFVWVNYHMDIADYLTSGVYDYTSGLGLTLGIIEIFIIMRLNCCLDPSLRSDDDDGDDTDQPIETDEDRPLN